MTPTKRLATAALTAMLMSPLLPIAARATGAPAAARDGSHDFDFDLGVWKTDITRRVDPLSGSNATVHMTGTVKINKVWNGKAQVEEIEANGPNGSHWEGMTVFLYDPKAHEWSMNFANGSVGKITPPMIGALNDGRITLYGADTFDGRPVKIRAVWSDFTPTSHTYQEYVSADDGKTWVLYFTGHKTKQQ